MLTLRQLTKIQNIAIPILCRQYAQKPTKVKHYANMTTTKQVHKEVMKYINQYAKIKIKSDIHLKVHAADVHRYPNADVLVSELHAGTHAKNCNIDFMINVSDDEKEVDVSVFKLQNGGQDFHFEMAVPVKATLIIEAKDSVSVEHMLGNEVSVFAEGNIKTRDVRCEKINLKSGSGHINCAGTLLGKNAVLETRQKGCILLDKLQGDELICKTEGGDIHTNCCYVESSAFETETGCLELKNVHKTAQIRVQKPEGALHMSGVHGNLQVKMNGHTMKLQLSELHGESVIVADNVETANINISSDIEDATQIDIQAQSISLNNTLQHLSSNLTENKQRFSHNPKQIDNNNCRSKLTVFSAKGTLMLGKQSWAEMMCGNIRPNNIPLT